MSSPFNPLAALTPALGTPSLLNPTASPMPVHPFLMSSPGGAALGLTNRATGSPVTNLLQLATQSGTPWAGAVSLPSVPGFTPANFTGPTGGTGTPQMQMMSVPPVQGVSGTADLDEALRAVPDLARLLERAEAVRNELTALENGVFAGGEGAERAANGLSRLEVLQLDYAQSLLTLISLSNAYLIGALPVPLSVASNAPAPPAAAPALAGDGTNGANPAPPPVLPTPAELAAWTESRAQTQFARREAVRGASKAVVDVLKGSRA